MVQTDIQSDQNLRPDSPANPALSGRNEKSYARYFAPGAYSPQFITRTEVDANDVMNLRVGRVRAFPVPCGQVPG